MAIDSALKRYSAMNIASPWRPVLPIPDGTIGAADRQIVPFLYSGILADAPVAGADGNGGVILLRRRRR